MVPFSKGYYTHIIWFILNPLVINILIYCVSLYLYFFELYFIPPHFRGVSTIKCLHY